MARFRPHRMYPGALLAQESCTYQAMTELLGRLRGDLVVLIHSDRDCANVLPKTRGRVHAHHPYKFLCTNLREDEMVTGQGNRKLRKAIELVNDAWHPALIVVLSTCPTVMIGDNIKNVTRKAARELGVRAVSRITHGLKPQSPAEVVDILYSTLSDAAVPAEGDRSRGLNLVGISLDEDEKAEIAAIAAALGLHLNVVIDERAEVEDFLRLGQAGWNVHPGPNMLIGFDAQCTERLQMGAIEVPLPYGLQASDAFWQRIAAATGIDDATLRAAVAPFRAPADAAIADFKSSQQARVEQLGRPLRLAYNIGSVRSFDLRRIALEELGELPWLRELGFDCKLFIQGPQHAENWDRTARVLADLGADLEFVLFPDPGGLVHFIQPGEFDLFYGARFLRDQLTQVNLPLLHHRAPRLGYGAVAGNVAMVGDALRDDFYRHFEAKVTSVGDTERLGDMLARGKGRVAADALQIAGRREP